MSLYQVNIKTQAQKLLPPFMRKERILAFVNTIISGVEYVQAQFDDLRVDYELRVKFNAQKAYLQEYLNRVFDPELKRIEVVDAALERDYYFELDEAPLSPEALVLMSENDTEETGITSVLTETLGDYIIEIPEPLLSALETDETLAARVDYFNPAGKSYLVQAPGSGLSSLGLAIGTGYNDQKDIYQ